MAKTENLLPNNNTINQRIMETNNILNNSVNNTLNLILIDYESRWRQIFCITLMIIYIKHGINKNKLSIYWGRKHQVDGKTQIKDYMLSMREKLMKIRKWWKIKLKSKLKIFIVINKKPFLEIMDLTNKYGTEKLKKLDKLVHLKWITQSLNKSKN